MLPLTISPASFSFLWGTKLSALVCLDAWHPDKLVWTFAPGTQTGPCLIAPGSVNLKCRLQSEWQEAEPPRAVTKRKAVAASLPLSLKWKPSCWSLTDPGGSRVSLLRSSLFHLPSQSTNNVSILQLQSLSEPEERQLPLPISYKSQCWHPGFTNVP